MRFRPCVVLKTSENFPYSRQKNVYNVASLSEQLEGQLLLHTNEWYQMKAKTATLSMVLQLYKNWYGLCATTVMDRYINKHLWNDNEKRIFPGREICLDARLAQFFRQKQQDFFSRRLYLLIPQTTYTLYINTCFYGAFSKRG